MSLKMRIYYNAVCGALGGMVAWALSGLFSPASTASFVLVLVRDALLGAIAGICIGGVLGAIDGVQARNRRQAMRGLVFGGVLGLIGGLIGLVAGELIFSVAGGGVWPRATGWAIFGALIGASEGLATRAPGKLVYGAVGGVIGGLIGGSTYERITDVLRLVSHDRNLSVTVGGASGLVLLGACLGAMIALTLVIGRDAWLRILGGRLEGREVLISKRRMTIGASDGCDVYLPGDPAIAAQHAVLDRTHTGYLLSIMPGTAPITVNQQRVASGARIPLLGGEHLRFGTTALLFYHSGAEEEA